MLFSIYAGPTGPVSGRGDLAGAPAGSGLSRAATASFSLVNLTANNTTVDVSMAFNISVDVVNLTGGAINSTNTSNYTFTWTGIPAFVPGAPGSGCMGVNPVNLSAVPDNDSSLLNCSAAAPGTFTVSVSAMNITSGQSNSSTTLSILVNALPTASGFTVNSSATAPSDHVKGAVNTSITFSVTASGGTGPLSYQYSGLPLGCSSNASTFSCLPNRVGVYNVTVTAIDVYGYTSSETLNVTVTVTGAVKTTSSGIGNTGWAIVIGILVVGALVTIALLFQARREERAGRMGTEQSSQESPPGSGESPPMGGTPPPGPPS
ncbi:MAG: hypothetical protein WA688_09310 [Thermoplasmata archaeon]